MFADFPSDKSQEVSSYFACRDTLTIIIVNTRNPLDDRFKSEWFDKDNTEFESILALQSYIFCVINIHPNVYLIIYIYPIVSM